MPCLCCLLIPVVCFPSLQVRWASCQALGQMCTDLGPDLQMRCGTAVLPALLGAMDDFQNPRVQAHASAAVVNFSEGCDSDIMRPHLDTLISKRCCWLLDISLC